MCGIWALLQAAAGGADCAAAEPGWQVDLNAIRSACQRRGPDAQCEVEVRPGLRMGASLLSLRGEPTPMPYPGSDCDAPAILCFNGQVFGGSALTVPPHSNDTREFYRMLVSTSSPQQMVEALAHVHGPWAFCLWKTDERRLYFGRDPRGRRSLLFAALGACSVVLSSVSAPLHRRCAASSGDWPPPASAIGMAAAASTDAEADGDGDGAVDLRPLSLESALGLWQEVPPIGLYALTVDDETGKCIGLEHWPWSLAVGDQFLYRRVPLPSSPDAVVVPTDEQLAPLADELTRRLLEATRTRVVDQTAGGSLPSETARVAVLFSGGVDSAVLALLAHRSLPPHEPIDLLNVAFEYEDAATEAHGLRFASPDRRLGLRALMQLHTLAPERRWRFVAINISKSELESTVPYVAALTAPCNDFMNVNIATALWFAARGRGAPLCVGPDRAWDDLLHAACADATPPPPAPCYTCPARILIVGIGADEQLAGYTRHRRRFKYHGWTGLQAELEMEMTRIWQRNLGTRELGINPLSRVASAVYGLRSIGRDDRVLGDHGRDARFPFLDENVVEFLRTQPLPAITDLERPHGVGDKRLLRLAAARLGLGELSRTKKQAIQFGSRIAKVGDAPTAPAAAAAAAAAAALPLPPAATAAADRAD